MTKLEQKLKALDSFKDWTNYLLITTVAALGWIGSQRTTAFSPVWPRAACIWTLTFSIMFAIFTLALIPHIGEELKEDDNTSIYYHYWRGYKLPLRLTYLCMPQHLLFLAGIVAYAYGTYRPPAS